MRPDPRPSRPRLLLLIIACSVGGAFIRPNETLLALGGFTFAMLFRPVSPNVRFQDPAAPWPSSSSER